MTPGLAFAVATVALAYLAGAMIEHLQLRSAQRRRPARHRRIRRRPRPA